MKTLRGFGIALLFATAVFAQVRSGFVNPVPINPGVGSVVHPGGSSAPGVLSTTGSVVHPGGGSPQIAVPGMPPVGRPLNGGPGFNGAFVNNGFRNGNNGFRNGNGNGFRNGRNSGNTVTYVNPYPVYVGGGYGYGYGYDQPPAEQQAPAQQPNIIVVMPPAPAYPSYGMPTAGMPMAPPQSTMIEVPAPAAQDDTASNIATHYLIALKDHSIYSAVAYWVDGDTLHYFTTGNTHNKISVSQVDRDLTRRLNEDSGLQINLPPAK